MLPGVTAPTGSACSILVCIDTNKGRGCGVAEREHGNNRVPSVWDWGALSVVQVLQFLQGSQTAENVGHPCSVLGSYGLG